VRRRLLQQSTDTAFPPGPQQQTRRTLLQRANRTDRRTDSASKVTTLRRYTNLFIIIIIIIITLTLTLPRATRAVSKPAV